MAGPNSQVSMMDGTLDFSGGVNSIKVPTIRSERNMGGLARNEQAWLINGAVRDGGIRPRNGWLNNGDFVPLGNGIFQGAFLYEPIAANPYFIMSIGGVIWKVDPDNPEAAVNLSTLFGLVNPPAEPYSYFVQAEQFLVIQAGDFVTLPLFWDGTTLRRSTGIVSDTNVSATITYKNVNDAAHVGTVIPAQNNLGISVNGVNVFSASNIASFVWPAVGASVVVNCTASTGTLPTVGFNFGIGGGVVIGTAQITARTTGSVITGSKEIPAAGAMDYYMGRIWYAQGKVVSAGDIVRGTSGTPAYGFRDSVLKVTENPLAIGGDGFATPGDDGNIRALKHSANIDVSLGQGRLYIFTRTAVYSLQVPVTRTDWINADYTNGPLLTVIQLANGSVNDRSVVAVNGDLYYRSFEPGVRSLVTAVRYFSQPGNIEISANEQRLMRAENRELLFASSGVYFNNRLLETGLPTSHPWGVTFATIAPLDFVPISGFNQASTPVWEGMYQGLNILQLASADFGGLQRAFAINASTETGNFQIWELTTSSRRDNVDSRITMQFETPAFTWGDEAALKRLIGGELWVDEVSGAVVFKVEYRPDSSTCWHLWHTWDVCNTANTCEDPENPVCYPTTNLPDSYRATMSLPIPREVCEQAMQRPSTLGYQFQCRVTITGWCRVRGLWLHAGPFERSLYANIKC